MTVRWRTLWRFFCQVVGVAGIAISTYATITDRESLNNLGQHLFAAAFIVLLLNYQTELRARIDKIEADWAKADTLNRALLRRLVNVMDSAHRNDPIYRERDKRDRETERIMRDLETKP